MLATRIAVAGTVVFPPGLRHELFERLVMRVRDYVARAFPALDVVSRRAPCGAGQVALAFQILPVHRRLVDRKTLEPLAETLEFNADIVLGHEDLAIVDRGVPIRGRDLMHIYTKLLEVVEQLF